MRQDYQGFGVVLQDDASDATHSTDYIQFYVDHIMPPDLQKRVRGKKGGGGSEGHTMAVYHRCISSSFLVPTHGGAVHPAHGQQHLCY